MCAILQERYLRKYVRAVALLHAGKKTIAGINPFLHSPKFGCPPEESPSCSLMFYTGACSCFLQLCGLTSDDLAIDSHALTRIIRHSKPAPPPHSVLLDVFTALTTSESRSKALSLLEEASKEVQTFPFANAAHSY